MLSRSPATGLDGISYYSWWICKSPIHEIGLPLHLVISMQDTSGTAWAQSDLRSTWSQAAQVGKFVEALFILFLRLRRLLVAM
jgi:hypothetical protein